MNLKLEITHIPRGRNNYIVNVFDPDELAFQLYITTKESMGTKTIDTIFIPDSEEVEFPFLDVKCNIDGDKDTLRNAIENLFIDYANTNV